jgi:hypothetical protein
LYNTPRRASRQRTPCVPIFCGTNRLKFTPEEQQAIEDAEEAYGHRLRPVPRVAREPREIGLGGAVARIIATIFGLIILGSLVVDFLIIGSRLSPSAGAHVEAQSRQPETHAPDTLPRAPLSESPESIDQLPLPVVAPPPIMPQIGPQAGIGWETQTEIQDNSALNALIGPPGFGPPGINAQPESETAGREQPYQSARIHSRDKQEFDDIGDMLAVLAKICRLSELKRQIHEGRWAQVEESTWLFEQPRFDSADLGRIGPGAAFYTIDTGLWCYQPAGLTWKIVLILTPYYSNLSYEGFVCTTRERAGAEAYHPRTWNHVPVHPQELARRTRMRPGFRRLLREAFSSYWTTPDESSCPSRGRRAVSTDEGIQQ